MSTNLEKELQEAQAKIKRQNEEMKMVLNCKENDLRKQEQVTRLYTIKPILEKLEGLTHWLESFEAGKVPISEVKASFEEFRAFVLDLAKKQ